MSANLLAKLERWRGHLARIDAGTMEPSFPFTRDACVMLVALFEEQLAAQAGQGGMSACGAGKE